MGKVPAQKVYSSVVVTAGTINYEGTIPLPSGYGRSQCKYAVWPLGGGGNEEISLGVNQNTGYVSVRYGSSGTRYMNAGYLCVAVK